MSEQPLVSVLMPVRDGERFVAQAIESVLAQDYAPFEFFVIEGHSTDRTRAIVGGYDRVTMLDQVGKGIADAWNLGIEQSRGELLAFISSDDRWTPNKLSTQVRYMQQHREHPFTIAKMRFFLEPGYAVPAGFNPALLDRDLTGRLPETLVARRELFDQVGRFALDRGTAFDVDWFARAKDIGLEPALVPEVLLHKRVHDANASSNAKQNTEWLMQILRDSIRRQQRANAANPATERENG